MKAIAITGNIGSGKSLVCQILSVMGHPIFDADLEAARLLVQPDNMMHLTDRFGLEVLTYDGLPDRKKLASIVFHDPSALQWLNHLLHPGVMTGWQRWLSGHPDAPLCFMESAIIFEHGLEVYFDEVVTVDAPDEVAMARVTLRDGVTREDIERRMAYQLTAAEKRQRADKVICNDGQKMLLPQVASMVQELLQKPA